MSVLHNYFCFFSYLPVLRFPLLAMCPRTLTFASIVTKPSGTVTRWTGWVWGSTWTRPSPKSHKTQPRLASSPSRSASSTCSTPASARTPSASFPAVSRSRGSSSTPGTASYASWATARCASSSLSSATPMPSRATSRAARSPSARGSR